MQQAEDVRHRLPGEPFHLQLSAVVAAAPDAELGEPDGSECRDEPALNQRAVMLPRRGMKLGHLHHGPVRAEGRPAGVPGREKRRDGCAAPRDLRVERREPRAVGEMAAVVEGAEGDLALDDLEERGAPPPVLGCVRQLRELPTAYPTPSEVEEQPAVLASNAHAGASVPSGASPLLANRPPLPSGTWPTRRTSPGPDA